MNETKVSLTIILPGSIMFSKEECLKTAQKTIKKTNKNTGKTYNKTIEVQVEDLDKMDINFLKVTDKKNSNSEVITFTTRKCIPARQTLNMSEEAYKYMTDKNSCPSWSKPSKWVAMSKKERLESHLQKTVQYLGGISYTYQIFDD